MRASDAAKDGRNGSAPAAGCGARREQAAGAFPPDAIVQSPVGRTTFLRNGRRDVQRGAEARTALGLAQHRAHPVTTLDQTRHDLATEHPGRTEDDDLLDCSSSKIAPATALQGTGTSTGWPRACTNMTRKRAGSLSLALRDTSWVSSGDS